MDWDEPIFGCEADLSDYDSPASSPPVRRAITGAALTMQPKAGPSSITTPVGASQADASPGKGPVAGPSRAKGPAVAVVATADDSDEQGEMDELDVDELEGEPDRLEASAKVANRRSGKHRAASSSPVYSDPMPAPGPAYATRGLQRRANLVRNFQSAVLTGSGGSTCRASLLTPRCASDSSKLSRRCACRRPRVRFHIFNNADVAEPLTRYSRPATCFTPGGKRALRTTRSLAGRGTTTRAC